MVVGAGSSLVWGNAAWFARIGLEIEIRGCFVNEYHSLSIEDSSLLGN